MAPHNVRAARANLPDREAPVRGRHPLVWGRPYPRRRDGGLYNRSRRRGYGRHPRIIGSYPFRTGHKRYYAVSSHSVSTDDLPPWLTDLPDLLSARDIAEVLHVTPATVKSWIRTGQLEALALPGRYLIEREALIEWVQQHSTGPDRDP